MEQSGGVYGRFSMGDGIWFDGLVQTPCRDSWQCSGNGGSSYPSSKKLQSSFTGNTSTPIASSPSFMGFNPNSNQMTFYPNRTQEQHISSMVRTYSPIAQTVAYQNTESKHVESMQVEQNRCFSEQQITNQNRLLAGSPDLFPNEMNVEKFPNSLPSLEECFDPIDTSPGSLDWVDNFTPEPVFSKMEVCQTPQLSQTQVTPSPRVELLFDGTKDFKLSFTGLIVAVWSEFDNVYRHKKGEDEVNIAIEQKAQFVLKKIDEGKMPGSILRGSYQFNEEEKQSIDALKNFASALVPALMRYYSRFYNGRPNFEANDKQYQLSATKESVAVKYIDPDSGSLKTFLTIKKPG